MKLMSLSNPRARRGSVPLFSRRHHHLQHVSGGNLRIRRRRERHPANCTLSWKRVRPGLQSAGSAAVAALMRASSSRRFCSTKPLPCYVLLTGVSRRAQHVVARKLLHLEVLMISSCDSASSWSSGPRPGPPCRAAGRSPKYFFCSPCFSVAAGGRAPVLSSSLAAVGSFSCCRVDLQVLGALAASRGQHVLALLRDRGQNPGYRVLVRSASPMNARREHVHALVSDPHATPAECPGRCRPPGWRRRRASGADAIVSFSAVIREVVQLPLPLPNVCRYR